VKKLPGPYKTRGSSRREQAAEEESAQQQQTQADREDTEGEAADLGGHPLGGDDASTVVRSRRPSEASEEDYCSLFDQEDLYTAYGESLEQAHNRRYPSSPQSPPLSPASAEAKGSEQPLAVAGIAEAKGSEQPRGYPETKTVS